MFLQFGDYRFEALKLPLSWTETTGTNYTQVPIIGGKPVVQQTGEKLVEHELSVLLSDEFCVPRTEYEALQYYRRNGIVAQLTGGDGTNYGKYVLTDISKTNMRAVDATGYISAISLNLKFLEYNTATPVQKQSGEALKSSSPVPVTPLAPLASVATSLQSSITTGTLKTGSISSHTKAASVKYSTITRLCNEANAAWTSVNDQIQNTKKIIRRAKELQNSVTSVKNAIAAVKQAAQAKSFNDLYAANTVLERAVYDANGAGSWVAAFVGSKEGGY